MSDKPYYSLKFTPLPNENLKVKDYSWIYIGLIVIFLHLLFPWLEQLSPAQPVKSTRTKVIVQTVRLISSEKQISPSIPIIQNPEPKPEILPLIAQNETDQIPKPPVIESPAPLQEPVIKKEPEPEPIKQESPPPPPPPVPKPEPPAPLQAAPKSEPPPIAPAVPKPKPIPPKPVAKIPPKPKPKPVPEKPVSPTTQKPEKVAETEKKKQLALVEAEKKKKEEQAKAAEKKRLQAELNKKAEEKREAERRKQKEIEELAEIERKKEAEANRVKTAKLAAIKEQMAKKKESRELQQKIITEQSKSQNAVIPEKISNLQIDAFAQDFDDMKKWSVKETDYSDEVTRILRSSLRLPDYGSVKIELTIHKTGKIDKVKVISNENAKNKQYIEQNMVKLQFPAFGTRFPNQESYTFSITLNNEKSH